MSGAPKAISSTDVQRVMRDSVPESLRRTLRYSRKLPLAVARLVRFKPASGKRIYLKRYTASWRSQRSQQFDMFAVADISISALLTNHSPGRGLVHLRDSPLYNFVVSVNSGRLEGPQLYRTYLQEAYGFSEKEANWRIRSFENLIESYTTEDARFTVAVRLRADDSAFLIDGAHRASIVCALGASDKIRALVAL